MSSPQPYTIYLLDNDFLILIRLKQILEGRGYKTMAFTDPVDFLQSREPQPFSCAFVDFQMPELNGIQVQDILKERNWNLPIIFISAHGTVPIVTEAMKKGGVDFIEKPLSEKNVLSAADRALELAKKRHLLRRESESARRKLQALSQRETEVLELLVRGLLNKQIGYELGIGERTVKVHRSRILEKLGVDSVPLAVPIVLAAKLSPDSHR